MQAESGAASASQTPRVLVESPQVYLADTGTAKGRGVFAARSFAEGELVERCQFVLFESRFDDLPAQVKALVFNWGTLAETNISYALALGYGSIYNHDNPANLRYEADRENSTIRFIAVRPIAKHEELTINYNALGGGAVWGDNNWFERMGVQPIVRKD